jgi:hypothetical protein
LYYRLTARFALAFARTQLGVRTSESSGGSDVLLSSFPFTSCSLFTIAPESANFLQTRPLANICHHRCWHPHRRVHTSHGNKSARCKHQQRSVHVVEASYTELLHSADTKHVTIPIAFSNEHLLPRILNSNEISNYSSLLTCISPNSCIGSSDLKCC